MSCNVIEGRSVTSRYHGSKILDHNNRELKQQTFLMQHAFLYISWLRYTTATWNFLTSRACFMECVNTTQIFFFFLNLDAVLSVSTPEIFANIWQIKWNSVRSMKFETVRINFFYDVFRLLSSRNLATMATWRNDFSLFCKFYFLSRSLSTADNK